MSVTNGGIYTIVEEDTKLIDIACDVPSEVVMMPTHAGLPPMPTYGSGLLGIGNTKWVLYVSICFYFSIIIIHSFKSLGLSRVQQCVSFPCNQ